MSFDNVLILDFGSQYTRLIARRVRELGFHSLIHPGDESLDEIKSVQPKAIILSGGPSSVNEEGAPQLCEGFLEWRESQDIPLLGICYGLQLLVKGLGGKIRQADKREYGRMKVVPESGSSFFRSVEQSSFWTWMSHGDEAEELPPGFTLAAKSEAGAIAGMENVDKRMFALQFHPEVTHTEGGKELLGNFLKNIAGLSANWTMQSVLETELARLKAQVGENDHVVCALSGGVDSAVAAVLVHQAIGDRLHCIFVDHGMLRFEEQARVMKMFEEKLKLPVKCVDASEEFLSKLKGVSDPEKKRKIIGAEFITTFQKYSEELTSKIGSKPKFLVQGTLYPDVIESSPPPSAKGGSAFSTTIKSHHNVGGLPEKLGFELIEPLRELFKDEVRELGSVLKVPSEFLKRHPFPGPGLAVRILGEIELERIKTLQHADEIYISELKNDGLYDEIWQAFAVFLPIKSVGVQGDSRTHDHVVGLRAVTSKDGMTADWYPLPHEFMAKVSSRICNEVSGVNRVVYDISSKPPSTIEWE